jgi:hypothetical protein
MLGRGPIMPYASRKMIYPTKADRRMVLEAAQLLSRIRENQEEAMRLEAELKLYLEKMGGPP